jgi:membrane protease subunit (stomatin/prohibitin family)
MGFFSNRKEGGLLADVIRCDESEYLVWKWRPSGAANTTQKENNIRYGSSLRVKESEVAVFVYGKKDSSPYDFIAGLYDGTIKTDNFPVLSELVGLAFGGSTPFQAEIYFINLSANIQLRFGIPWFDVYDTRFPDLGVPCAVRGTITFNLPDYRQFIKLNRLIDFDLEKLKNQVKDLFIRKSKTVIINLSAEHQFSIMQIESRIDTISELLQSKLSEIFYDDFGIRLKRVDISAIELDKEHLHYQQLKKATADQQTKISERKTDIELDNLEETIRIQRKDLELGVEGKNFAVHQLNQQTNVLKTAAENLGAMGNINLGGGLNPVGIMTGMAIGGVMGNQMGGMMHNINNTPPPLPISTYHVAFNGQQLGQFSLEQLKQSAQGGQFTKQHHVWKEGMSAWELASNVAELANLFLAVPPPPPTI